MNPQPQSIQCLQCGAVCVLDAADVRWSQVCNVCGAPLPKAESPTNQPNASAPLAVPIAAPVAGPGSPANHNPAAPSAPVEYAAGASTAAGSAHVEGEEDELADEDYQVSWLAENALMILGMTMLLAVAGVVVGLAWGGFRFSVPAEESSVEANGQTIHIEAAPATLVNAAKASVRRNGVKVKVIGATWDRLWAKDESNQVIRSPQLVMAVRFRINNQLETQRPYRGWRDGSGAQLEDSTGRLYQPIGLSSWKSVMGAARQTQLPPGEVIEDLIAFQAPDDIQLEQIEWLRVRMPAAIYEGAGEYYFEIPRDMIEGPRASPTPPNWDDGSQDALPASPPTETN